MKKSIGILLALVLLSGAGLAQAGRGGGGGHGGGGHAVAGGMASRPGMSGGFTHFTTGPMHFTTGPHPVHPIVGVRPAPIFVGRPFPPHRVIVGGAVVVAAPFFWYPPYPYPYPYAYVPPGYGGPAYTEPPEYIEQGGGVAYYCPDYQDYYPNVQSCPSEWMQVVPGSGGYAN